MLAFHTGEFIRKRLVFHCGEGLDVRFLSPDFIIDINDSHDNFIFVFLIYHGRFQLHICDLTLKIDPEMLGHELALPADLIENRLFSEPYEEICLVILMRDLIHDLADSFVKILADGWIL